MKSSLDGYNMLSSSELAAIAMSVSNTCHFALSPVLL